MNSSVSTFFSRDAMLQRQARTIRARKAAETLESASMRNKPLNIILEEDESSRSNSPSPYYASTSAGGSQTLGVKAKRRHANVSDIRIARNVATDDDNDLSPLHDILLSAPRAAPRPPSDSPDSFKLTFTDVSFKFPHPPTPSPSSLRHYDRSECGSPTSSYSSSPCSQSGGMPLTPSTSDDESSNPAFNPRRAAIQPLVITKHNPRSSSPFDEISSLSPSLLQPFKNSSENSAPFSPLTSAFLGDASSEDSDSESDSEWYTREFSKILTLCSPIPPSFPLQHARPDSMSIPAEALSPQPASLSRRRVSRQFPSPPTSTSPSPSGQLDPAFPSKRASKTRSIPKYPPPPVPPIPAHFRSSQRSSPSPSPNYLSQEQEHRRPPPRFSVPADCDFELDEADDADDSSSAFSFSMYEIDLDHGVARQEEEGPESPGSAYSQPSFDDEVAFDLEYALKFPLSLPTSPIDLEADINLGLEQLWTMKEEPENGEQEFTFEESEIQSPCKEEEPAQPQQEQPQQQQVIVNDLFSPLRSTSSPAPSSTPSSFSYPSPAPSPSSSSEHQSPYMNEDRHLKSKWSTSTLGSVREEHERRGASSKLRLYFGGQSSPAKRASASQSAKKEKVPSTPTSPFSLISPRKTSTSRGYLSPHSSSASPSPSRTRTHTHHSRGASNSSDVMVIGYGVRRRGSVSTVSEAGSEESASSTSSSGLRRKPIPVEMFLRGAA
ncbi:hypothetical protein GALMADRAFT_225553 [Galerina marginata CBS 339.88]|uniref:Uncharacterized protein n=1 Tax=Galerina marginata (strain CBS 339.88) TaxID=685588 RepID=A0A067T9D6_GALM3|nr:hypothetical protein GALMADRAFT_225553 [Galerina marginata CBS 339.88]